MKLTRLCITGFALAMSLGLAIPSSAIPPLIGQAAVRLFLPDSLYWLRTGELKTSFLDGADKIYVESYTLTDPQPERIVLYSSGKKTVVDDLGQLAGAVHISSALTALQYVRLQTGLTTWDLWPGPAMFEVITQSQAASYPNYGWKNIFSWDRKCPSGWMGVLSEAAYKSGGFSPPRVETQGRNYLITRWIATGWNQHFRVQLIQERVSLRGAYRRHVLRAYSAPKLPGTEWEYPMAM